MKKVSTQNQLDLKKAKLAKIKKEKELKDELKRKEEEMKKKESTNSGVSEINKILENINKEKQIKEDKEREEKAKLILLQGYTAINKPVKNYAFASFVGEFHEKPNVQKPNEKYEKEIQVDLIPNKPKDSEVTNLSNVNLEIEKAKNLALKSNVQKGHLDLEAKEIKEIKEIKESKENKDEKESKEQKIPNEDTREKSEDSTLLNENQVKEIMDSDEFLKFFDNSTKIIENIFENTNEEIPIYIDYNNENKESNDENTPILLTQQFEFEIPETKGKPVLCIEWSKNHKDLLLAAYAKKHNLGINEKEGIVALWSMYLKRRPEEILLCPSEVLNASFDPYNSNEIIGGTSAGYLVIWDVRAKPNPMTKSLLSYEGNSGPIFYVSIKGSQNSHYIYSVSSNGKVCLWNKTNLNVPIKSLSYVNNKNEIGPLSIAFPESEPNICYLGCDDNRIYSTDIAESDEKSQNLKLAFEGHEGPITSLSFHPQFQLLKHYDASQLLLSSSIDWKIKLWNPKKLKEAIFTFDSSNNYVLDVEWNPINPSIFSSCNAEGYIDIWNIAYDIESPLYRMKAKEWCINKVKWSPDGRKIACGDINGSILMISADPTIVNVKQEDIQKMEKLILSH